MLSSEQIPVGKLKQAFELSANDTDGLLSALLPDKVFPYALWQEAHDKFWQWSLKEAAYRDIDIPDFPEFPSLPEEHYPEDLHCTLMKRYFGDISRIIRISTLENGINYIIEATYGSCDFPYKSQKESLFISLREEERSEHNWNRTSGLLHIDSVQSVDYGFLTKSFMDTVVVHKMSAINVLLNCGYPFRREVKGITQNLVDSASKTSAHGAPSASATTLPKQEAAAQALPHEQGIPIPVPTALWTGKTPEAILAAMRLEEYDDAVIAYVLHVKRGFPNKTEIGRLLDPSEREPSTYRKKTDRLLAEASRMNIIDV